MFTLTGSITLIEDAWYRPIKFRVRQLLCSKAVVHKSVSSGPAE